MSQSLISLHYHFIFGTRDGAVSLTPELKPHIVKYIGGILRNIGCRLIIGNGGDDHLHLLVAGRADTSVADILRLVKSNSSKWVNEMPGRRPRFAWQSGYAAYTVSLSVLPKVKAYIRDEEEHHRTHTYAEECDRFFRLYEEEMRKLDAMEETG